MSVPGREKARLGIPIVLENYLSIIGRVLEITSAFQSRA